MGDASMYDAMCMVQFQFSHNVHRVKIGRNGSKWVKMAKTGQNGSIWNMSLGKLLFLSEGPLGPPTLLRRRSARPPGGAIKVQGTSGY